MSSYWTLVEKIHDHLTSYLIVSSSSVNISGAMFAVMKESRAFGKVSRASRKESRAYPEN